jgi:arylsulfatase A-like enzyme/tetratricopeptide (TPR) repeat protein
LWTAVAIIAAGAALLFTITSLQRAASFRREAAAPLNILLVTLDTARADRIGAYGYAEAKTSHFDRLAAEGVRFERAVAQAPITLPSHASLFTARFPFTHGVRNNGNFYLSDQFPTLATALHDRGYRTGAFVSSFILDRRYGLARGFDEYDDRLESARKQVVNFEVERRGDQTALKADAWLERYARENGAVGSQQSAVGGQQSAEVHPFFLWLHLYDPHEPYRPPQPFRDMFADRPYDGEIAFTDTILASVMDRLDKLGLLQSTLIAVVGDHGESLGDHGEETHSMFVYEPALRVPLILWRPGRLPAGRIVQPLVRVLDLAPTLLDLIGAPPLAGAEGRSLMPLVNGDALPPAPAYAETYLPLFYMNWSPLRALEDERWKYIDAPKPELYDLASDPKETNNLAGREPARAAEWAAALTKFTGGGAGPMTGSRVDRETLDKLASLGYVAAAVEPAKTPGAPGASGASDAARPDPKDVIAVFNRLRAANSAVRDGRFADATVVARSVLAEDPKNAFARIIVASAQLNQGAYKEAIAGYRAYLDLVPTSAYAHHWIAICYIRLGDRDRALAEEEAALAIDPNYADARVLRGGVFAALGRFDEAIAELTKAVATDPDKAGLRLDLAKVLVDAGRLDEAEAQYRRALALAPADADVHTGFGVLLAERKRLEDAVGEFSRALEIDPLHDEARFDLARVLEQQGKTDAARTEYERVAASEREGPIRSAARRRLAALRR